MSGNDEGRQALERWFPNPPLPRETLEQCAACADYDEDATCPQCRWVPTVANNEDASSDLAAHDVKERCPCARCVTGRRLEELQAADDAANVTPNWVKRIVGGDCGPEKQ
jgi:hypothetical protein